MDSGNGSQPPITGLFLVALVLGTIFFVEPPLHGSRPKDPPRTNDLSSSEQVIPARLWQDPFEAIVLNRSTVKSASDLASKIQPRPTLVADESAPSQCSCDLSKIFRYGEKDEGYGALLVMTPGSPYVEDGERRIRARYAVTSALGVAGLSPRDSQHIGCARLATGGGFDMPFEWFDPPDKGTPEARASVLVAWLPEEKFSLAPLKGLNHVINQLRSAANKISIAVVGPNKSGTLNTMRMELLEPNASIVFPEMRDVRFYSPSATMDERLLLQEKGCPRDEAEKHTCQTLSELYDQDDAKKRTCQTFSELYDQEVYEGTGNGFTRTILSDSEVSRVLIKELDLRGLEFKPLDRHSISWVREFWIQSTEFMFQHGGSCDDFNGHRDHVVLISELDTLYGRNFPRAFIRAASDYDTHNTRTQDDLQWIHRFSYLRGLDGQVPAKVRGQTSPPPPQGKTSSGQDEKEVQSRIKRAANTPRFDYLRRLAGRVERLDGELRKHYCGSIKAVGVLGSDVYDKLLILQALREKFPNSLFFTADMDARYLHPTEFKWTRNLIVSSSHGLEPKLAFGSDIPPFRDSYQTSRFLATLLALSKTQPAQEEIKRGLCPPRVYEIGRTAARDLTDIGNNDDEPAPKHLTQVSWFRERNLPGQDMNRQNPDGNATEFASLDSHPLKRPASSEKTGESFLHVHDVRVRPRFDHLQSNNYQGHFIIAGRSLALLLAILGIGYYLRRYFGLHPILFMRQNWESLMSDTPGSKTDIHLAVTTAMLWMTLLLVGLSNLTAFLLLGVMIIFIILIGRVSNTVQTRVLEFLQKRRLPVEVALVLLLGALFWAVYLIVQEGRSFFALGTGEPFSLRDGISMWPGEVVRIVAGVVSIGFMVSGWRSLKEGDRLLNEEFFPPAEDEDTEESEKCARARRVDWCSGKDNDSQDDGYTGPFDARTNWNHYQLYRTLSERWNSVLFPATLFFLLGCVSIYWVDDFHVPYRGDFIYRFDHVVVFGFMVPAFLLLLFAVIDETSLCVGWVRRLTREFTYKTKTNYFLSHTCGETDDRSEADRDLEEIWTRLQVVARRTRRVSNLIIGPFVVLFLILVSQSPYFDNWDIPAGLIIMIALSAAYAILCAIKLRRVSENARREAIVELTQRLIRRGGKDDKIELLLDEARQIKDGGFLPWTRQPWLKAMFWLVSALGIMSAQYISLGALG